MYALRLLRTCNRFRTIASISIYTGKSASKRAAKPVRNDCSQLYEKLPLQVREMSSYSRNPRTAYPQYHVFGERSMLCIKIILPKFRTVRGDALVTDKSGKGRMLLEFTPSSAERNYQWNDQVRFALSPEEVGLFCNQLPHHEIELSRRATSFYPGEEDENNNLGAITNNDPVKILKVSPRDGASVAFTIDFVKNGIGGQSEIGPLEVVAQAGEFEIIAAIMRSSLPVLVGWSPLVDIALQYSINETMHSGYEDASGQQPWTGDKSGDD